MHNNQKLLLYSKLNNSILLLTQDGISAMQNISYILAHCNTSCSYIQEVSINVSLTLQCNYLYFIFRSWMWFTPCFTSVSYEVPKLYPLSKKKEKRIFIFFLYSLFQIYSIYSKFKGDMSMTLNFCASIGQKTA